MMPAILIFLVKSILCSGLLFGYYRVALYNRAFHQFNRYFLGGIVVISLVLPLLKIPAPVAAGTVQNGVIHLLDIADNGHVSHEEGVPNGSASIITLTNVLMTLYLMVSFVLLCLLLKSFARLIRLYRSCPVKRIGDVRLIITAERDAPFSFFRNIFWKSQIDIHSQGGKQILDHEMTHVREAHSIDRIFINLVLVVFWCNPIYWLIRKEMTAVHEFIADAGAIHDRNTSTLSGIILLAAYPTYDFATTSRIFSSSIKRRLTMLTKTNARPVKYFGRLFVWPVLLLVMTAFTLCTRKNTQPGLAADNRFTVMIDAGHGGDASGGVAPDGTLEKDIVLSIAKKLKQLNNDDNIHLLFTRTGDENFPLRDRVSSAVQKKVDAFISVHVNLADASTSGFEYVVSKNKSEHLYRAQLLGSLMSQEIKKIYASSDKLMDRDERGVWVLDAPEINYPSILVECGNLNNAKDLAFIKSDANQEKVARQILNAITLFAQHADAKQKAAKAVEITVNKGEMVFTFENGKVKSVDPSGVKDISSTRISVDVPANINDALVLVDRNVISEKIRSLSSYTLTANKKLILFTSEGEQPLLPL